MLNNIPQELRAYPQFVVWRYEHRGNDKPTKVPYDPKQFRHAKVDDPATWGTFEQAVERWQAEPLTYAGIGFVLTEQDPYTIIDLDDTQGNAELLAAHVGIFKAFDSYSERSPSGTGLHIICKGHVSGRRDKSKAIEVYSSLRYMTMTGDVFHNVPIAERQHQLRELVSELGGAATMREIHYDGNAPEPCGDREVLDRALNAVNGEKFADLMEGRWSDYYGSQSEADFAYIDILAFYTQNREQIARIFRASSLGQREKGQRVKYVNDMITRAFDKLPMPVDTDALMNGLNAKIDEMKAAGGVNEHQSRSATIAPPANEPSGSAQGSHTTEAAIKGLDPNGERPSAPDASIAQREPDWQVEFPPGMLGDVARFMLAAAPRPVPEIALSGAIAFMGGIAGRAYNVQGAGLNQYTLLIAPTGMGKEALHSGMSKLLGSVAREVPSAMEFLGPGAIASGPALIKRLAATPCFVSVLGEFGKTMRLMCAANASSDKVTLQQALLDVYGKSGRGNLLNSMIYSDKEKNTQVVHSPSFSILGEAEPEGFYATLDETVITSGLLPRCVLIEWSGHYPPVSETFFNVEPSEPLREITKALTLNAHNLMHQGQVLDVQFTPGAKAVSRELQTFCDAIINQTDRDVLRHLWTRVHLKVLKLAALVAVGISPYEPVIDEHCFAWAKALVLDGTRKLIARFERGEIGSGDNRQYADLRRVVSMLALRPFDALKGYGLKLEEFNTRQIPYSVLHKMLAQRASFRTDRNGAAIALRNVVDFACESGFLVEVAVPKAGAYGKKSKRILMVGNPDELDPSMG